MIGGTARITRATTTLTLPMPSTAIPIASTARLGSARPMFAVFTARNEPRCRWPSHSPIGSAIAIATATATTEIAMCSSDLFQSRPTLSPMNWNAWMKVMRSGPPQSRPWRDESLHEQQQRVGGEGENHGEAARCDQLRREVGLQGVKDRRAEALV